MAIGKAPKWMPFATAQQTPASASVADDTAQSTVSIPDEKQFGFENFGNTCYANSVLQTLYFCSPFRDLVIQSTDISAPPVPAPVPRQSQPPSLAPTSVLPRRKTERGKATSDVPSAPAAPTLVIPSGPPTLFSALRSLYVYISRNQADKGVVAPRAFIDKLRDGNELFRGIQHQDAHEFLNYLLNKIVEEIQFDKNHKDEDNVASSTASREDLSSSATLVSNNAPTRPARSDSLLQTSTLVHRLFQGTLTSETRCLTCETVSSRDESFLDLSIDIEQNSSVTACLRQFSASEMLCQRNKFFCDSCCGLQEAEKRMKIKKLPNILALHLKRFKYQEDLKKYIKLTYRVAFPLELRLFNTVDDVEDPDRLYELFGIVIHIGSGPHHGHYVAIVKGPHPHSWLMFDDDKIETIKESEIPRYFGDAAAGSAYVLYYQAADLDPALLGIKLPTDPTVPEVTVTGSSPASAPNAPTTNEMPSLDLSEPALPPGLGESPTNPPATVPTPHPPIPHPPIPTAPSSPSLVTLPLGGSHSIPSRKKSLPSIRIPGISISDNSTASPTTPNRAHGGLFHTLRSSPSSSKIRPSTTEGAVSTRSGSEDVPPVPPVPLKYVNGKEVKEKEREKDKSGEHEREEERSSKEFDRRPSLWFKRRNPKPAKDGREKEKEKDAKGKDKDKDANSGTAHAPAATPSHATTSATVLAAVPSQSDGASSVSGASSIWRRSSARVGHHVKRLSATYSTATLGEADAAAAAASSLTSSSSPSNPPPHPPPHHHHHHLPHHHHHHHHYQEPPGQLSAVPATPQNLHPDRAPSSPSSTSSSPALLPAEHRPPSMTSGDAHLPPPTSGAEGHAGNPGGPSLPAWLVSPASPLGSAALAPAAPRHTHEHTPIGDGHDKDDRGDEEDETFSDDGSHLRARVTALAGRLRGRPHSVHGSGSGTPRDRSTSPQDEVPSPHSVASHAESGSPIPNGVPLPSSASVPAKGKEPAGLRRAARKLSLNTHWIGLGLGLVGRDKDRDHQHQHQHHLGKKEDGKKAQKMPPTGSQLGLGGSSAALASAVP